MHTPRGFPGGAVVKNPPANAGDTGDGGPIPGWERSPQVGNDNPLQISCLENSMGRGAKWATVHRVAKSWKWLQWLSLLYGATPTSTHDYWKNHTFDSTELCWPNVVSGFNILSSFVRAFLPRTEPTHTHIHYMCVCIYVYIYIYIYTHTHKINIYIIYMCMRLLY